MDYNFNPPENQWTHLVVSADSTATRLYINGKLVDTISRSIANYSASSANTFRMGGNIDGDYQKLMMDEVLFYDRALTAAEVTQIYGGTIP